MEGVFQDHGKCRALRREDIRTNSYGIDIGSSDLHNLWLSLATREFHADHELLHRPPPSTWMDVPLQHLSKLLPHPNSRPWHIFSRHSPSDLSLGTPDPSMMEDTWFFAFCVFLFPGQAQRYHPSHPRRYLFQGISPKLDCEGRNRDSFRLFWSLATSQFPGQHEGIHAAQRSMGRHGCVPIKLYWWTPELKFHMIFVGQQRFLCLFFTIENVQSFPSL